MHFFNWNINLYVCFLTFFSENVCPAITTSSCPTSSHGDDVVQLVPKRLPPDHALAKRPELAGKEKFICSDPGKY